MKLKLQDLGETTKKWIQEDENKPLFSYFNRGFFRTRDEVNDLHRSYSPYRIPRGLTKLQVRRRINRFVKDGRKLDSSLLTTNRVTILFNGDFILGASITSERPKNSRQMDKLLRDLLTVSTSRKRPMPRGF